MGITAKETSKALRAHVFPLLRANAFDDATNRKFWRHRSGKTDHVEISSMSAYRAKVMNCTTASFSVSIGISLPVYGYQNDPYYKDYIKIGPKGPRPQECQMPIRGVLCPSGSPPLKEGHWGWECRDLWEVNSIEEAEEAAIDLRTQLEDYALEWLNRSWDLQEIEELLLSEKKRLFLATSNNGSHLQLNAELPGSPIRRTHISMVQKAIKHNGQS